MYAVYGVRTRYVYPNPNGHPILALGDREYLVVRNGQVVHRTGSHALALAWVGDRQTARQGPPCVRLAAFAHRARTAKES